MRKNKYDISVIVPIFNTEEYLREALDSIVGQSIGFKSIQLILVNDGSTDSSGEICKEYLSKYPDNVFYIEKENGGVSSACNAGLNAAEGKYINFFGSDDKWDLLAFEKVLDFLDSHRGEIDLVACRLGFFDSQEGFTHPLDYRFEQTKIVDLSDEFWYTQMMSGNCIFTSESLEGLTFNESLSHSEDALVVNTVLLDKLKYGVIREAVYHYRKRADETALSAIDAKNKARYLERPVELLFKIFEESKSRYKRVLPFIQYLALYESVWVIKKPLPDYLSQEEKELYKSYIIKLLQDIDTSTIMMLRHTSWTHKVLLYKLKFGRDFGNALDVTENTLFFDGNPLCYFKTARFLNIKILEIENDVLHIEAVSHWQVFSDKISIGVETDSGTFIPFETRLCKPYFRESFLGPINGTGVACYLDLPLNNITSFRFAILGLLKDSVYYSHGLFSIFAKLTERYKDSYYVKSGFLLKFKKNNFEIKVESSSKQKIKLAEKKYCKSLRKRKDGIKRVLLRKAVHFLRPLMKKPIWILSDRFNKAGDNAENLFKYLHSIKASEKYNIYFLFEKEYEDYLRLKQYGKILNPHSYKYRILFLLASKIISAHADPTVMNPFKNAGFAYSNMFSFDYVYIQHGVMPGDLSSWLNKMNKNAKLITTSAQREYDALLGANYGYKENEIALTGMARHDALGGQAREKLIVFLPTWRQKLAGTVIADERRREHVDRFSDTEYCKFYNKLINDERLLQVMKNAGYRGEFYVHPSFEEQAEDFVGNEIITVGSGLADYERILNVASLMVTDYSSVAFDFGWQQMPVVYTQFDWEDFGKLHFYEKGYFDYLKDGFGPVCYSYKESIETLIKVIESNCQLPEMYKARGASFFAYQDHNNAKRTYEAICALDEREK